MSEPWILWNPVFPASLVIVGAFIGLVGLLFFEYRRKIKYRAGRMLAQFLFVCSITLLILRPSWPSAQPQKGFLLLTNGYDPAQVSSILGEHPALEPVSMPDAKPYPDARALKSYHELASMGDRVATVVGHGLPSWALGLIQKPDYTFAPSPTKGISRLNVDNRRLANRWNTIEGTYTGDQPAWIRLRGPAGIEDSIQVTPGESPFTLNFFSKSAGHFMYEVTTPDANEPLPLYIEPEAQLSVVIIVDYPTFETRYLKNFLASKGHRVTIRTRVSKEKFKFEFDNITPHEFKQLNDQLLSTADILVIDARAFQSLNFGEQKSVRANIVSGLGVVLLPDPSIKKGPELLSFAPTNDVDTVSIKLPRANVIRLPSVPLRPTARIETIASSTKGRIMTGYQISGLGKIGFTLLKETYQLGLQSKGDDYSLLWVPLFEKCARTKIDPFQIKVLTPFPRYTDAPIDIEVLSNGKTPRVSMDSIDVPVSEDLRIDDVFDARIWVAKPGWHELKADSTTQWLYVAAPETWSTVTAAENMRVTSLHASAEWHERSPEPVHNHGLPTVILFLIFVGSSGFLWLAPKL